eukprot:NODE_4352_length_1902_cov_8.019718.p1 GENE.NODE_4352_length_1902_cov_8.019718~~NODE_4352_length_1902_cov_8.019718.p1  ORF type:complete len:465 (+),score=166.08 NODE_4352_length_1902_cov_8.019718:105-1499(+)
MVAATSLAALLLLALSPAPAPAATSRDVTKLEKAQLHVDDESCEQPLLVESDDTDLKESTSEPAEEVVATVEPKEELFAAKPKEDLSVAPVQDDWHFPTWQPLGDDGYSSAVMPMGSTRTRWIHIGVAGSFVVVALVVYTLFRRALEEKEGRELPSITDWKDYIFECVPAIYVAGSALAAAVMSMEAGNLQAVAGMPAAALALVGTGISTIVLLAYLLIVPGQFFNPETENPWRWHIIQGVVSGNTPLMAFYAIPRIGLSQACAIMFTMPLWTALFALIVLRAPWGRSQLILSIACAIGVILVLQPEPLFGSGTPPAIDGICSALGFATFNAAAILIINEKLRKETPVLVSFFMMVVGAITAAILLATGILPGIKDGVTAPNHGFGNPQIIFQAAIVGALLTLMNMLRSAGFQQAKSSAVANMLYLEIVFANLLDVFVVHGNVNVLSVVGSATIVIGSIGSTLL